MTASVKDVLANKDLLKPVFQQLGLQDLCTAAQVCQLWCEVANNDEFWKTISFQGKTVHPENAIALLRRHRATEELDLTGLSCGSPDGQEGGEAPVECIRGLVRHVAPQLTNLRKLSFSATAANAGSCCLMANQLVAQLSAFGALTCLSLGSMRLSRGGGLMGQLAHTGLRELALDDSETSALNIRCPALTHLSLSGASNTRIPEVSHASSLVSLDISRCVKLLEASTRVALMQMTALQQLSISGITSFLDQTVVQLATSLVSLSRLDMSRVSGVTLQSVRGFPELVELDLTKCEQLQSAALTSTLESFEKLEALKLDSCSLGTLTLSLPKLKSLSVRGCHNLSEVEVRAWQLSHLDLGPAEGPYSAWVANSNLAKLSVTSGALRQLELVKLNKLNQIDLDCPTLSHLVVRKCDFTDASVLRALGDTAPGPIMTSDVLSTARKSAPQLPKPLQPGSLTMVMLSLPGGAGDAGRMDWIGPAEELDDNMPMAGALWGEDGDELPGGAGGSDSSDGGCDAVDDDEDGDDEDPGGQLPGGMGALAAFAAAAAAVHPGGRGVCAGRGGAASGRGALSRPVATWQAPDRLRPDLVRCSGAAARSARGRGGAGGGRQPPAGSAGASSSAAAAAAPPAATGGGGGPPGHGDRRGRSAGHVQPAGDGAGSLDAATAAAAAGADMLLMLRDWAPGQAEGGAADAGGDGAQALPSGDDDDALGGRGWWGGGHGADAAAALKERERVRRTEARLEREQQDRRTLAEYGQAFWQGPDQLPPELVRFGAAAGRPSSNSSGGHASGPAGDAGAGSSQAAAAAAAGAGPSSGPAAAAAAGPLTAAAAAGGAGPSCSAAGALRAEAELASHRISPSMYDDMMSFENETSFIWGSSGEPLQELAPSAAQSPAPVAAAAASSSHIAQGAAGEAEVGTARDMRDMLLRRRAQRVREGGLLRTTRAAADGPRGSSSSRPPAAAPQQPHPGVQRRQLQQQQQQLLLQQRSTRLRRNRAAAAMPGGGWGDSSCSDSHSGDSDDDRGYAAAAAAAGGGNAPLPPPGLRIASGKGGVPRLRVLQVESCERVQELQLCHQGLEELVVSGCGGLVALALHAPKLSKLELQDLGDLKGVCLVEVAVPSLTMGSCSSLQGIELSSKTVVVLDVRGCGGLQQLHLDCPALQVLDANFCATLGDEGLSAAVASIPPLRKLALSVCTQIGSTGLASLSQLTTLQDLDLSYTEVDTLQPILESCPHLQTLSIASCRGLSRDALLPLLDPDQPALAQLQSLDASYCDVQDDLVAQLLLKCRHLRHLALSGCSGVTDAIWQQVEVAQLQTLLAAAAGADASPLQGAGRAGNGAPAAVAAAGDDAALMDLDDSSQQAGGATDAAAGSAAVCSSKLESLSLVRCNNLRSLCLGLLPACGQVQLLEPKHYLLAADRHALQAPAYAPGSWLQVDSAVSELTSLKLGLSGLQVVALALPKLAHLDLSSCKQLRVLELRCPLLLQLQLQACRSLPVFSAVKGVLGAPHLQMLDVQHVMPHSRGTTPVSDRDSGEDSGAVSGAGYGAVLSSEAESMSLTGPGGVCRAAVGQGSSGSSLLAAVAADGTLPAPVGMSTEAQIGMLLDEVAATHGSLKSEGILRCLPVCKVCSKLAQCSL